MRVIGKIISGGQTGADRAGLDAAMHSGIPIGGHCPQGYRCDDGFIPAQYALLPTASSGYTERTELNVMNSDATLIFTDKLTPGSKQTEQVCIANHKPYHHVPVNATTYAKAGDILKFLAITFNKVPLTINIAGSRERICPGIYNAVYRALITLFRYTEQWWLYCPIYSMYRLCDYMDKSHIPPVIPFYSVKEPYGEFSQFYEREFVVGDQTYCSMEQFMHAEKAQLFSDINIRTKILTSTDPVRAKHFGRKVRPFDNRTWGKWKELFVIRGNCHKFAQHSDLLQKLLSTDGAVLVEATANDSIWGCGLNKDDDDFPTISKWPGQNLLGFCLMAARRRLQNPEFVSHCQSTIT